MVGAYLVFELVSVKKVKKYLTLRVHLLYKHSIICSPIQVYKSHVELEIKIIGS